MTIGPDMEGDGQLLRFGNGGRVSVDEFDQANLHKHSKGYKTVKLYFGAEIIMTHPISELSLKLTLTRLCLA
jgi:hypothetical protein